jgi:hypothetical protein
MDASSVLYSLFETSLIRTLSSQHKKCIYVEYKHTQCIRFYECCLTHTLFVMFDSTFIYFSNSLNFYYFMPFRNISCGKFTIWCNKYTQHFTLIHKSHPLSCYTYFYLDRLFASSLCTFIIFYNTFY